LALIAFNVYQAVQSLGRSGGFGFGLQEPVFDPKDTIRITTWARGPWWDTLANPGLLSVLGNFAVRHAKAFVKNELKVLRCFENNRFSAAVSYATQGSRFHGTATFLAQSAEILPSFSVAGDGLAMMRKSLKPGALGSKNRYASGLNMLFRKMAKGTLKESTYGRHR